MRPRLAESKLSDLVDMFPALNTVPESLGSGAAHTPYAVRTAERLKTCDTDSPNQGHMALCCKCERLILSVEHEMETQPAKWKPAREE
jgi:hypothetical protein